MKGNNITDWNLIMKMKKNEEFKPNIGIFQDVILNIQSIFFL